MTRNIIFALLGKVIPAALTLGALPVIAAELGFEQFGLVAFYVVLQAIFQCFDFGATQTYTRELSRHRTSSSTAASLQTLTMTLEILLVAALLVVVVFFLFVGDSLVLDWLNIAPAHREGPTRAIHLMGAALGLNYFILVYQAGLYGFEQIGTAATISCVSAALRTVGSIFVLRMFSDSVEAYFLWLTITSILQALITRVALQRLLGPSDPQRRFDGQLLRRLWRFSLAVGGLNILSVVATQSDRIYLSTTVSIASLGYYALALQLAATATFLVLPVKDVLFPRFAALLGNSDGTELAHLYHRATRLILTLVLPVTAVLTIFPEDVVLLWTRNPTTAHTIAPIVRLLAIGFGCSALALLPYALQLAMGWVSLQLRLIVCNLLAMAILLPVATHYRGLEGAAACFALLNGLYLVASVELMHARALVAEKARWYLRDVLPALMMTALSVLPALVFREYSDISVYPIILIVGVFAVTILSLSIFFGFAGDALRLMRARRGAPGVPQTAIVTGAGDGQ